MVITIYVNKGILSFATNNHVTCKVKFDLVTVRLIHY